MQLPEATLGHAAMVTGDLMFGTVKKNTKTTMMNDAWSIGYTIYIGPFTLSPPVSLVGIEM